jgi:predicted ribosome quality control (RQC) complex YloA/Tae2 family protein
MKEIILDIQSTPVMFYIGRSQQENHAVLDYGKPTDLWFHLADTSSCHVVAVLPEGCDRKLRGAILRRGASLCKQHTPKAASQRDVPVTYTTVSNVTKDIVPGRVTVHDGRTILV